MLYGGPVLDVQSHHLHGPEGGDDSPYDRVAELHFDDEAAYDRAMFSDLMAELLDDLNNFTNPDEMLLLAGEESVLIDTAAAPS